MWLLNIEQNELDCQTHMLFKSVYKAYLTLLLQGSVPDIKWVDGAKQIFKVKVHVRSTVYTTVREWNNYI